LGRALAVDPKVLILDEPTRGVGIGAKREIYRFIEELASNGVAILIISSEMEEVLRLSDRVIVMRRDKSRPRFPVRRHPRKPSCVRSRLVPEHRNSTMVQTTSSFSLGKRSFGWVWQRTGVLLALVLLVTAAAFLSDRFLTLPNLLKMSCGRWPLSAFSPSA
jgi:energy-coupling factor transporter ATP-binding protein EcfA2